jgi:hypothetical protein
MNGLCLGMAVRMIRAEAVVLGVLAAVLLAPPWATGQVRTGAG